MGLRRDTVPGFSSRVLSSPAYRRLWISGVLYYSTFWLEIITTGWIILEMTDSPFQVGLSGFFRMLPMLLFGSFLGVVADRVRRIDILIGVHGIALFAAIILALTFMLGTETVWLIYLMVTLIGTGWAADFSARRSLSMKLTDHCWPTRCHSKRSR
ncbi:MAG: MFS transporter [Thermomicrobiales bacterium]